MIAAAQVKELRDRTGAGMMECKQALIDAHGDVEQATRILRERGAAKAEKRSGRLAKEGRVESHVAAGSMALVELNCETDFVARTEDFLGLARALAALVCETRATADTMGAQAIGGQTVAEALQQLAAKTGENVQLGALAFFQGAVVGCYVHHDGKGAALVELSGGDAELAKAVAQHAYASMPRWTTRAEVPAELVESERAVIAKLAETEGKSGKALEGFVSGRLRQFFEENCLVDQVFVRDLAKPKAERRTIAKLLGAASVARFQRIRVGEA